jgi:hypothetical protein
MGLHMGGGHEDRPATAAGFVEAMRPEMAVRWIALPG